MSWINNYIIIILFNNIYTYKHKDSGDHYQITNIGYVADKGASGIDGYHIFGGLHGKTNVPEVIMTKDIKVQDNLCRFVPDTTDIPKWKRKYIYNLQEEVGSQEPTDPEIFIATT